MSDPGSRTPAAAPAAGASDSSFETELGELRHEIDAVDTRILEELNRRAEFVLRVGQLKQNRSAGVYSAARERDLTDTLVAANPGPFPDAGVRPVFREIVSATRSLESRVRIAYLGPPGTFSHLAARDTFGAHAEYVAAASLGEVFAIVERGEAEHGIVPVENTTEGVVTPTLDALLASELAISGESLLRISHHLMSSSGQLADVRRVASHPQPLAQCRIWLDRHLPGLERIEMPSTSAAAELATREADVAAIGSSLVAELCGLEILAGSIEDQRDNTTRFLVIGGDPPPPSGHDLTSVAYTVRKGESGALHKLLKPFSDHGVNLASIQARPLKGTPWEYVFFIDLEGHLKQPEVRAGFEAAAAFSNSHRVLGSFPRATEARNPSRPSVGAPIKVDRADS
ncbi:MAG: prephenate dehydratase [Deltaproteobacteria bacterium]|nr:prephenate dehydratase [Deltaproteobacteria bacterium]MBW2394238.1 prephenate dehydratase [Deltaproteobacteria bacterium]